MKFVRRRAPSGKRARAGRSLEMCLTHDIIAAMAKEEITQLFQRAKAWPEDAQQELAQSMEGIEARYYGVHVVTREDRAALKRSEDDVKNGRFASEKDIKKVLLNFHRA